MLWFRLGFSYIIMIRPYELITMYAAGLGLGFRRRSYIIIIRHNPMPGAGLGFGRGLVSI